MGSGAAKIIRLSRTKKLNLNNICNKNKTPTFFCMEKFYVKDDVEK